MSGKTLESKDHIDPIIHRGYLVELADAYAPTSLDRRNPLLSPLFSVLAGFPPTLIQVGSAETLLSDLTRFAEAAAEANVATTLEVWPEIFMRGLSGMLALRMHGWRSSQPDNS